MNTIHVCTFFWHTLYTYRKGGRNKGQWIYPEITQFSDIRVERTPRPEAIKKFDSGVYNLDLNHPKAIIADFWNRYINQIYVCL